MNRSTWTGVHEDIVITIDGDEIAVEPAEGFSNDPAALLEEKHSDEDGSALIGHGDFDSLSPHTLLTG